MRWVKVDTILDNWMSVDVYIGNVSRRESWLRHMAEMRRASNYSDIVESIRRYGFRRPSKYITGYRGGRRPTHHEGHHRLAAAIELGYKYIPYTPIKRAQNDNDGRSFWLRWGEERIRTAPRIYIHPENPVPECLIESSQETPRIVV